MTEPKMNLRRFAETAGMAALRLLDPETAHGAALLALRAGLAPTPALSPDPRLHVDVAGMSFLSPIGVAAGFDKNAEAPDAMLAMGYGFVEIGAVTPRPQSGNPRPRLFRLAEDKAVINRFGFNNQGMAAVQKRLHARRRRKGIVWANLGANKESEDRAADYIAVMEAFHGLTSAMTLNVSSPNTERLRDLQGKAALQSLLGRCVAARDELAAGEKATPLFLKIAPDLTEAEISDIAEVAVEHRLDGVIATNTTIGLRDAVRSANRRQAGGLSGAPLFDRSSAVLATLARRTEGRLPLIGVGGVGSAEQAYAKIRAGASLVQLYSALVYEGPGLGARLAKGLSDLLHRDGFATVSEAVGADL